MKKSALRLTIILLLVALCVMQFSACGDEVSTPNQPGNEPTGGDMTPRHRSVRWLSRSIKTGSPTQ